ncbi:MAG: HEAT repeat domain-containing protein [Planctomycetes bacterium]|nr:HEAT repeat domain-containing protein [Planctomycetota bacterium]MBI3847822.1 HEAT repeat domain-containing protein [Planctomycetota bacterium]
MNRFAVIVFFGSWLLGGVAVAMPEDPQEWHGAHHADQPAFVAKVGQDEIVVIRSLDEWARFWHRVGSPVPEGFDAANAVAVAVLPGRPIAHHANLEILAMRTESGDVVVYYAPVRHWCRPVGVAGHPEWQYLVRLLPTTSARVVGKAWSNVYEFVASELERQRADAPLIEQMKHVGLRPDNGFEFVRAVPALIAALQLSEPMLRRVCIETLAYCGTRAKAALPALIDAIADSDADVRNEALKAVAAFGLEARAAVPALVAAMKREPVDVRRRVASTLGCIGPAAAPAVSDILADALLAVDRSRSKSTESYARALRRIGIAAAPAILEKRRLASPPEREFLDGVLGSILGDFFRDFRLWK